MHRWALDPASADRRALSSVPMAALRSATPSGAAPAPANQLMAQCTSTARHACVGAASPASEMQGRISKRRGGAPGALTSRPMRWTFYARMAFPAQRTMASIKGHLGLRKDLVPGSQPLQPAQCLQQLPKDAFAEAAAALALGFPGSLGLQRGGAPSALRSPRMQWTSRTVDAFAGSAGLPLGLPGSVKLQRGGAPSALRSLLMQWISRAGDAFAEAAAVLALGFPVSLGLQRDGAPSALRSLLMPWTSRAGDAFAGAAPHLALGFPGTLRLQRGGAPSAQRSRSTQWI